MKLVSIPRSEFWLFGPKGCWGAGDSAWKFQFPARNSGCSDLALYRRKPIRWDSFNSPLGILVVRTPSRICTAVDVILFQFPARNSGCSDMAGATGHYGHSHVSIPRSEFWLFGQERKNTPLDQRYRVSIPRSEFWLFGHKLSS